MSKRSRERCRRRATLGAVVCVMHGAGSGRVKAKAAERVGLAEALASSERRHPGEVLLDALHTADVLARGALDEVKAGRVTVRTLQQLVDSTERASRLAKTTLDAGLAERQTRLAESQAAELVVGLQWLLAQLPESSRAEVKRLLPVMLRHLAAGDLPPAGLVSAPAVTRAVTR